MFHYSEKIIYDHVKDLTMNQILACCLLINTYEGLSIKSRPLAVAYEPASGSWLL